MLSVVIFPLITPALLCGVVATRELIGGAGQADTMGWIRIMLAFDLTFLVAGYLLFEPLTTE